MPQTVAVAVLCIAVAGVSAQWLAWRLRLPAIVLLFAVGLIVGPGLRILQPNVTFGTGLHPIVGLAVAIVVFEGGLALDLRELRAAGEGVLRLTIVALPISFVLSAFAAHLAAGMAWGASLLFGAITVVTGPTVVLPLLRNTRLERRASSFLKWEAIVNDPIGALIAAIVLSLMLADGSDRAALAGALIAGLIVSFGLGIGAALLIRWLVSRDLAPETLKTPMLLALALGIYVVSNLVLDGSGLVASTAFGIALANMHIRGLAELARFKEALVVLIVSALFIVLTASLDRSLFAQLSWPIFLLTLVMVVVVRPLAIALATMRSGLTWQERVLAGWIAPRGIVAAAVAGVASAKLSASGYHGGEIVMPAVFSLIAATMVLHGFSLAPVARRLGLTLGDRPGLAIVGATPWTLAMAQALIDADTPVLLVDSYPGALDNARATGVPVLQAEILSQHGSEALADHRIDYLLASTQSDVYNSLVCAKLAASLGRGRVFQMSPAGGDLDGWQGLDREWRGQTVGVPPVDFATLRRWFKQGWQFVLREHVETDDDGADAVAAEPVPLDEVSVLILRRNGELSILSSEANVAPMAVGDKTLLLRDPHEMPRDVRTRQVELES